MFDGTDGEASGWTGVYVSEWVAKIGRAIEEADERTRGRAHMCPHVFLCMHVCSCTNPCFMRVQERACMHAYACICSRTSIAGACPSKATIVHKVS